MANNSINQIDPLGLFGWADMPTIPQPVSDMFAGFGDTLTSFFGLTYLIGVPSSTEAIRGLLGQYLGLPNVVDPCSKSYKAGRYAAYAWGVAFGAALGITPFAQGGIEWHIGLKRSEKISGVRLR